MKCNNLVTLKKLINQKIKNEKYRLFYLENNNSNSYVIIKKIIEIFIKNGKLNSINSNKYIELKIEDNFNFVVLDEIIEYAADFTNYYDGVLLIDITRFTNKNNNMNILLDLIEYHVKYVSMIVIFSNLDFYEFFFEKFKIQKIEIEW